jgi:hypothetical protein
MREQYGLGRSWRILSRHRHVGRSSLVEKFASIREVGELGSIWIVMLVVQFP